MARKKPSPFSTTGFARVHEKAGTPDDVKEFLNDAGLSATETKPKSRRSRRSSKSSRSKSARSGVRTKGRTPFKSRSFRLPLEIDDILVQLASYYNTYLVGAIEIALRNEFERVRREQRRASKKSSTS